VSKLVQRALLLTTVGGFVAVIRARYQRWGATDADLDRVLAGDAELSGPTSSTTRAITITAPTERVWPWIAQLGQGRGGFYSYDWLENLVPRTDIHNADRIVPEWQDVVVGSQVRLAPEVPLRVAAVDVGRSLVLRGSVPIGTVPAPYDFTWAFVLLAQPDGTTRLLVRERYAYYYSSSGGLGTDQYPPFTLGVAPDYPATLDIAYPAQLSRGLVLIKWWLLAIPHYVIIGLLVTNWWGWSSTGERFAFGPVGSGGLFGLLVVIAAVILLISAKYPQQLFAVIVGFNRGIYRVIVYATLMTDQYPPFRLDQGGSEPTAPPPVLLAAGPTLPRVPETV